MTQEIAPTPRPRKPRGRGLLIPLLLLSVWGGCGEGGGPSPALEAPEPAEAQARVVIAGARIDCEVMDTPALRAQGLSGRQGLPRGRGMLFVFDRAERHAFWMKDMHFDIDIIWITGGEIVDLVHARAPSPGAPPPTYTPDSAAEYVLEVVAGTAAERGWAKGSPVGIEWLGERP